jgi:hypothetical protein
MPTFVGLDSIDGTLLKGDVGILRGEGRSIFLYLNRAAVEHPNRKAMGAKRKWGV